MSEPTGLAPPVSIEEQARFQRITFPIGDENEQANLQEALDVAIEHVEKLCGPISTAARTYKVRPRRDKLVLPVTRLAGLVEVVDPDGNTVEPWDSNLDAGIITLPIWPPTAKSWTVTATTGEDVKALQRAVKIIASHLYKDHRGHAAMPGGRAYPSGEDDTTVTLMGFSIPRRAAELMAPYLKGPR